MYQFQVKINKRLPVLMIHLCERDTKRREQREVNKTNLSTQNIEKRQAERDKDGGIQYN